MRTPPHAVQEKRLVPEFQNSYLLLQRLDSIDESEHSNEIETNGDFPDFDAALHLFDSDGDAAGVMSWRVQEVTPDDGWPFKAREVLYPMSVNPRKPVMGLLPLGEITLSQLSDAKSEELGAFRK